MRLRGVAKTLKSLQVGRSTVERPGRDVKRHLPTFVSDYAAVCILAGDRTSESFRRGL